MDTDIPANLQNKLFGAVTQTDYIKDFVTCPAALQAGSFLNSEVAAHCLASLRGFCHFKPKTKVTLVNDRLADAFS